MKKLTISLAAGLFCAASAAQAAVVDVTITGQNTYVDWELVQDDPTIDTSGALFGNGDALTLSFTLDDSVETVSQFPVDRTVSPGGTQMVENRFWAVSNAALTVGGQTFTYGNQFVNQRRTVDVGTDGTVERSRWNTAFRGAAEVSDEILRADVFVTLADRVKTGAVPLAFDPIGGVVSTSIGTDPGAIFLGLSAGMFGVPDNACPTGGLCQTAFEITSVSISPDPIAPVPLPASLGFLLAGLGGLGIARTRKRRL